MKKEQIDLLKTSKDSINDIRNGANSLMFAAHNGHNAVVQLLLDNHLDVDSSSK